MGTDETPVSMSNMQESDFGEHRDYTYGAPHLGHPQLRTRIESDLTALVKSLIETQGRCRALEVGAGHGTFTDTLVRAGASVTVTEMSAPSAAVLQRKFRDEAAVRVIHDPHGSECKQIAADGCDLLVFISVLHHIPDYLQVAGDLVDLLEPGGGFYCAQDPKWYPSRSHWSMGVERAAYLFWRIRQGNLQRGVGSQLRRLRGVYDETQPSDMIEYHVVRQGVDERALEWMLKSRFHHVEPWFYWSTQSEWLQRLGERAGWISTFGMTARSRLPETDDQSTERNGVGR